MALRRQSRRIPGHSDVPEQRDSGHTGRTRFHAERRIFGSNPAERDDGYFCARGDGAQRFETERGTVERLRQRSEYRREHRVVRTFTGCAENGFVIVAGHRNDETRGCDTADYIRGHRPIAQMNAGGSAGNRDIGTVIDQDSRTLGANHFPNASRKFARIQMRLADLDEIHIALCG